MRFAARGLSFRPNDSYRRQLERAGADHSVLKAVNTAKVWVPSGVSADKWDLQLIERLTQASVFVQQKKLTEAADELASALKASIASPEAGFVMGAILRETEDWPQAAAVYKEVLRCAWQLFFSGFSIIVGLCPFGHADGAEDTALGSVRANIPGVLVRCLPWSGASPQKKCQ